MIKIAAAAVALAAVPLLAACGSGLSHGTVTGKSYDAPWTYYNNECMSYGKYGNCTFSITVPVYYPADYELQLKDGKQTGSVEVDEGTWDTARVGEQWPPATGKANGR